MTSVRDLSVPAGADILDARLRSLYLHCRDSATELRDVGMALDRDPDSIGEFLHLRAFDVLRFAFMPRRYRDEADAPPGMRYFEPSCLGWAVVLEALSYGEPGAILANAGPGLSRDVVEFLGDEAQQDRFFGRLTERPTWTFFALTEPRKGSAALELETALTPNGDGWSLHGAKRYVGNGARGELGVVFCRRAPGPWGIEAVLVDTAQPGFSGELLPMIGLRGARISSLRFDGMAMDRTQVLGRDRPPSRRGLHGAMHALLRFRPGLAAMALGLTHAICDYVYEQRSRLNGTDLGRLTAITDRCAALRRQIHEVCAETDRGVVNPHRISAVKARAATLGEQASLLAAELLGPASLVEHPWLEKAYRDVRGFEYMEGTTNLHRSSVFQGLVRNHFFPPGDTR